MRPADSCPGVDPVTGVRPDRVPAGAIKPLTVPPAWRSEALTFLARAESGSPDVAAAYLNVSAIDQISLGFLQWNHNAGSLYTSLLKGAGPEAVLAAPASIRAGVQTLADVADGKSNKSSGGEAVAAWRAGNNVIRDDAKAALQAWLGSAPLMARQDALIDDLLRQALALALAWAHDWDALGDTVVVQRAFYSFADLITFNGSLDGLWVDHVKAFEAEFADDAEILDYIADWVDRGAAYVHAGNVGSGAEAYAPTNRRLYRRAETPLSVQEWQRLAGLNDPRVDSGAIRLLILGYLRALRSNGNDRPRGFHGVFQLDVLNRRGMMATGVGVLAGEGEPTVLYTLR